MARTKPVSCFDYGTGFRSELSNNSRIGLSFSAFFGGRPQQPNISRAIDQLRHLWVTIFGTSWILKTSAVATIANSGQDFLCRPAYAVWLAWIVLLLA